MVSSFLYLVGLLPLSGSVFITSSPKSILNARIGSCVVFECKLNSETVYPSWSINGTDYPITDLPLGHAFRSESYTGQLTVGPLNRRMNNTVYYCYVVTLNGREESAQAHLIITKTNPENTHINCETILQNSSLTPSASTVHTLKPESTQKYFVSVAVPITATAVTIAGTIFLLGALFACYMSYNWRLSSAKTPKHSYEDASAMCNRSRILSSATNVKIETDNYV